jgi:hypothetical protein
VHLLVPLFLEIRNFSAGYYVTLYFMYGNVTRFLVILISYKDKQSEVRPTTCHDGPEGVGGQRHAPAALSPGKVTATFSTGG